MTILKQINIIKGIQWYEYKNQVQISKKVKNFKDPLRDMDVKCLE